MLLEHGYAGMTMQRVQDAAGISRGALTHHFASMAELAAATVEAVAERQTSALSDEVAHRGATSIDDLADALLVLLRQPTFVAGLELWGAARTDEALRTALLPGARRTGRVNRRVTAEVLGLDPASAEAHLAVDGLMSLLRGLGLGSVLRSHGEGERAVLVAWLSAFQRPQPA